MMLKYLTLKNRTFWYRRKIKGVKEIVFSLKTKNYDLAIVRHSYINYKINYLITQGIEFMTDDEIKIIIDKYKNYMLEKQVNKFSRQRDKELAINLNGNFYGGHTKEALQVAINKYSQLHSTDDYDLIKAITSKILNRSNIKEEFDQINDEDDLYNFHWALFKEEWKLLYHSMNNQKDNFDNLRTHNVVNTTTKGQEVKIVKENNGLTISELTKKYIDETSHRKDWSVKNERDINNILGHFSSYHNNKEITSLQREDFVNFRDEVLKFLPQQIIKKEFKDKSIMKIIQMVKKQKLTTIGLTTLNKHLRRVHQVFEWGQKVGHIPINLSKDLDIKEKNKSKKIKTAKIPYTDKELKKIFELTPWFNEDIIKTLRYNPEYVFVPLLALFTGAKNSELAQLTPNAFKTQNGVFGIDFNMMIKTTDSERFTPISHTLIELGLMDFVKYQKKKKEKQLFPKVKVYKDNDTNFTNAYTIYNRKYISQDSNKTFYSFRHLVNQKLKNKRIPTYIINDITGHSHSGNKDEGTYGDGQMPDEILRDVINECLVYDFIDFSKIKEAINQLY